MGTVDSFLLAERFYCVCMYVVQAYYLLTLLKLRPTKAEARGTGCWQVFWW